MKLYTKEQVTNVWQKYWLTSGVSNELERLLEKEKSIELPSDDEISQEFKYSSENWEVRQALEEGAKWVIKQITKTK